MRVLGAKSKSERERERDWERDRCEGIVALGTYKVEWIEIVRMPP